MFLSKIKLDFGIITFGFVLCFVFFKMFSEINEKEFNKIIDIKYNVNTKIILLKENQFLKEEYDKYVKLNNLIEDYLSKEFIKGYQYENIKDNFDKINSDKKLNTYAKF